MRRQLIFLNLARAGHRLDGGRRLAAVRDRHFPPVSDSSPSNCQLMTIAVIKLPTLTAIKVNWCGLTPPPLFPQLLLLLGAQVVMESKSRTDDDVGSLFFQSKEQQTPLHWFNGRRLLSIGRRISCV